MYHALEERLKAIEVAKTSSFNTAALCLVPGIVIPRKFKVPDFDKYKGVTCPETHLRSYCRKMAAHADNEPLLMHLFQDSLTGAPLEWYMQLERTNIRSWGELADAFLKHYHYNTAMAPSRAQLQNMAQKPEESFKEYAQRWRSYLQHMVSNTSPSFSDVVIIGERVENCVEAGTIQCVAGPNNSNGNGKKPYSGFVKKKEGETSTASVDQGQAPVYSGFPPPYYPMPYVVPSPYVPQNRQQNPRPQGQRAPQRQRYLERHIDPVPMPYAHILPQLLANQLVQLRELGPPPDILPPGYDNNLMPPHAGATNAIELCDEQISVTDVNEIRMPLAIVREHLVQQGILRELHDFCLQCSSNPEECARLRNEIQKLIDEGILRVERVVSDEDVATLEIPYYLADVSKAQGTPLIIQAPRTPLVIQAPRTPLVIEAPNTPLAIHSQAPSTSSPASSSLGDSKVVPWSYNDVGRIFAAPPPPPKETNKDVNAQTKGKQVAVDPPEPRTAQDAE
ncbi:uncharacterized protein LOC131659032 [Vicia villosa]|uniref:uncharacterized protein LOC131659032 n=1 Tax=Vicia villosa TaxID=3911 RepID=UPI00273A971F|nr:uncharacterized protein LOC131659032 [Vicia villosa]